MIDGLEEWQSGKADTLAVILHGWASSREKVRDVTEAAKETLGSGGGVDIYVPDLPYSFILSVTRASTILIDLLAAIDKVIAKRGEYKRIVLIGHSMGGVLSRRLFLLAAGIPPAVDGKPAFQIEEAFAKVAPRKWAALIERNVTLGAFNRGWQASERDGWTYSLFFNTLGLLGHLSPRSRWRPTLFDLRLGAPFIVQTRLHWLAYRRWHQAHKGREVSEQDAAGSTIPPHELLVVQIVGNKDDLASPLNQVDIAVERPDFSVPAKDQRYFFLEMRNSTHSETIMFTGDAEAGNRRALFIKALTEPPEHGPSRQRSDAAGR